MDVYKTPSAQVSEPFEIKPRPIQGVIFGALTDLVLSVVFFAGFALAMGFYMASNGATEQQIAQLFIAIEEDPTLLAASYVIGGASSAVGGYVCARYARINELRYGCVLAGLLSLLSILFESTPTLVVTGMLLTWIAVLSGCYWGRLRNRQDASAV